MADKDKKVQKKENDLTGWFLDPEKAAEKVAEEVAFWTREDRLWDW